MDRFLTEVRQICPQICARNWTDFDRSVLIRKFLNHNDLDRNGQILGRIGQIFRQKIDRFGQKTDQTDVNII